MATLPMAEAYRITVSVEDAGPWLEEHLGLDSGTCGVYTLTYEAYESLRQFLIDAGCDFTVSPGNGGVYEVLIQYD